MVVLVVLKQALDRIRIRPSILSRTNTLSQMSKLMFYMFVTAVHMLKPSIPSPTMTPHHTG